MIPDSLRPSRRAVAAPAAACAAVMLGLAAALLLCGCPSVAPGSDLARILILHTNDLHGQVRPLSLAARPPDLPARTVGGFPALSRYLRAARAEAQAAGRAVLLVDAGDCYQGTPEGDMPHGRLVIDLLNHMQYDLLAIGNHEFDQGPENAEKLARAAAFPWLGANVRRADAPAQIVPWLSPYVIKEVAGVRIAFVGLTTSDMASVTTPFARVGLVFPREEEVLAELLPALHAQEHPDFVVLVTHCGFDRDKEIAARFPELRLILGGHSHTGIEPTYVQPATGCVIAQNFSSTRSVDRVEIFWDRTRRAPASITTKLVEIDAAAGTDPAAEAIVARYAPQIENAMNETVGTLEVDLVRETDGIVSSPLGNVMADLMREATGADVAFHNRAGIRANLLAGVLREREIYQVSPFGNTLVTMTLTGKELRAVLEHSVASGTRFFLEVSGIEYAHDPMQPEGARVRDVRVAGKPLDDAGRFKIVTNNFLSQGGDGNTVFGAHREAVDTAIKLLDAQRDYFRKHSPFRPVFAPRVKQLGAPSGVAPANAPAPAPVPLPKTPPAGAPQPAPAGAGSR
ncbi:MAG: bifunctional metallophosphatase/5'-nucleotidase [Planctomycetes bacterium]|nr:bifunctional metallophosphatase/5'-nucleotidase [Planctomycetota bacterium]